MKIFFIYDLFYDFNRNNITIGGIQTYLTDLAEVVKDMGYEGIILQYGDSDNIVNLSNCKVQQLKAKNANQLMLRAIDEIIDPNEDVIIYGTDSLISTEVALKKAIAIQHGISWDMPGNGGTTKLHQLLRWLPKSIFKGKSRFIRTRGYYRIVDRLNYVKKVVCVDYNFVNWYRTLVIENRTNLRVIPNYTRICNRFVKPSEDLNIIFARRFYWYRGTRVFAAAIKRILDEYNNIHVTVAGSGPDEPLLREQLGEYKNVEFISYKSEESMAIHSDKHIAVVPTVGSEGTSLSLLEAMSAQCAVVCTNVGGMTNIVLDGYNGLMVPAGDDVKLYEAIKYLIDNKAECQVIADKGYETVRQCFSIEKWKDSWKSVLKEVVDGK